MASLAAPLSDALRRGPVPLLALRLPEFERIAWREGKRAAQRLERATNAAFVESAGRVLRAGDRGAHDPGSDVFAIAMTAPSRHPRAPLPVDIRTVLERIAAAISMRCALRVETGWTMLGRLDRDLERDIALALERGARERERYEFFSAIGHELRTPLTSIRGYLETLLDGEIEPATARRFLETARREALRMGRLLEGMFEFSLLDLSGEALAGSSCDLEERLLRACEVVRPIAQNRDVTLQRLPAPGVRAAIDPDACLQMLVNLLDNAVKYGRDGGVVRVAAYKRGDEAVVSVDDDGPGIAAHERESIFGLRVRGSSSATRPGTGIGLAIVKLIAERAGGEIRVSGSPLGGARFEVSMASAS
ncbi:MAG TPA: HAMP domain-containing sensor histidine kinase [Candidatus Baltobacteraceae bacterium]|nr:HAMP domain-containing sensor histidine kinase [Candidatus Baltobacteraceae bacterium]